MTTRAPALRGITAVAATVLLASTTILATPASAAPDQAAGAEPLVVAYDTTENEFTNSKIETLTGTSTGDGGCTFQFPSLELAPDQSVIEARQIETDFTNCTTKVETGVPTVDKSDPDGEGTAEDQEAGDVAIEGDMSIAATSSKGYYRLWWEDVVHLDVHQVKTNVSWTWNRSCVTSSSGSANYWWLTGTGWGKSSSSVSIARACSNARVYTDAVYRNGVFCWPGTVKSTYNNVTAQGKANGYLVGWVDGTSTSYPALCPHLHYHTQLKRTQN